MSKYGSNQFYKGKYIIAFYDKTDTWLLYVFDNVREILKFMEKDITPTNINAIDVCLMRALISETHFVKFLTGDIMKVYIIDITEEDSI